LTSDEKRSSSSSSSSSSSAVKLWQDLIRVRKNGSKITNLRQHVLEDFTNYLKGKSPDATLLSELTEYITCELDLIKLFRLYDHYYFNESIEMVMVQDRLRVGFYLCIPHRRGDGGEEMQEEISSSLHTRHFIPGMMDIDYGNDLMQMSINPLSYRYPSYPPPPRPSPHAILSMNSGTFKSSIETFCYSFEIQLTFLIHSICHQQKAAASHVSRGISHSPSPSPWDDQSNETDQLKQQRKILISVFGHRAQDLMLPTKRRKEQPLTSSREFTPSTRRGPQPQHQVEVKSDPSDMDGDVHMMSVGYDTQDHHPDTFDPIKRAVEQLKSQLRIGQTVQFMYGVSPSNARTKQYLLTSGVVDELGIHKVRVLLLPDKQRFWKGPYIHLLPDLFRRTTTTTTATTTVSPRSH